MALLRTTFLMMLLAASSFVVRLPAVAAAAPILRGNSDGTINDGGFDAAALPRKERELKTGKSKKSSKSSKKSKQTPAPTPAPSAQLELVFLSGAGNEVALKGATESAFVAELCNRGFEATSPESQCPVVGGVGVRSRLLTGFPIFVQFEVRPSSGRRLESTGPVEYSAVGTFLGDSAEVANEAIEAANDGFDNISTAISNAVPETWVSKVTESPSSIVPSQAPNSEPDTLGPTVSK